jgi:secreted Zn-dependent insulinase-like peptidase
MGEVCAVLTDKPLRLVTPWCRYAANMASQQFQISLEKHGLLICMGGFSHKQLELYVAIIEHMRDFVADPQPFEMIREQLTRQHRNSMKSRGRHARSLRLQMLLGHEWSAAEIIAELRAATSVELIAHVSEVLKAGFPKVLVHGNQPAEFSETVGAIATSVLSLTALPAADFPVTPVRAVSAGEHWLVAPNPNEGDDTSVVECYFQIGGADDRHYVLTDMVVDLMSEPIFNELRTKEQLG